MKNLLLVPLTVLLIGAMLFLATPKSNAEVQATPLPETEIYQVGPGLGITDTVTVTVNTIPVTPTQVFEGKTLWYMDPAPAGTYLVQGSSIYTITTWDLFNGTEYITDTLGVYIRANEETWGRTGVVKYPIGTDNRQVFTITGRGYWLSWPPATLFWDFENNQWVTEPIFGYYTVLSVPTPPQPPPTYKAFLPLVVTPSESCWEKMPLATIEWATASAVKSFCSQQAPIPGSSSNSQAFHNWDFVGLNSNWISYPNFYEDSIIKITPEAQGNVGVVLHSDNIYTVYGQGFNLQQKDWAQTLYFWNFETKQWSTTPVWGLYNIVRLE